MRCKSRGYVLRWRRSKRQLNKQENEGQIGKDGEGTKLTAGQPREMKVRQKIDQTVERRLSMPGLKRMAMEFV